MCKTVKKMSTSKRPQNLATPRVRGDGSLWLDHRHPGRAPVPRVACLGPAAMGKKGYDELEQGDGERAPLQLEQRDEVSPRRTQP
eukprot:COSAG04_NODE_7936_length_1044_cov_2.644444_2_plen_84_part_01